MEENTIKVYVKLDNGVVVDINSSIFLSDTTEYVQIDEGNGDKYSHAQGMYLEKGLRDIAGKFNYKVVDGELVELTDEEKVNIVEIKQAKIDEISNACKNAIYGGFISEAHQGVEKIYGTSAEDQLNITGNALSATSKVAGVAECANDVFYYHASGEDFAEWTALECLQLARDFKGFKETILFKSKMLQSYVDTLTKVADINAVNWDTVIPTV